ncbi:MoaD/ThiS family protein [Cellvibrio sp. OA-2007]|uniref:MoaD/ThiS family protein n=1 Tax=Cellvibrio sp. OA-2007 TaxID=529823 RepID=UPI0007815BCB|nr:MoaD/ThiS family protein [Cellvibrio sp. OA-2007]
MIKVCFFADLRERLGCADMLVEHFSGENIAQLKDFIVKQHPQWEKIFLEKKLLIAVNHAMANNNSAIVAGDEVAFFPPVTGG